MQSCESSFAQQQKTTWRFNGFLNRTNDLKHSYEKFRFAGGVNKPPFDKVYHAVKTFLADIIPK